MTLSATISFLDFSLARKTLPKLPFPRSLATSKSSSVQCFISLIENAECCSSLSMSWCLTVACLHFAVVVFEWWWLYAIAVLSLMNWVLISRHLWSALTGAWYHFVLLQTASCCRRISEASSCAFHAVLGCHLPWYYRLKSSQCISKGLHLAAHRMKAYLFLGLAEKSKGESCCRHWMKWYMMMWKNEKVQGDNNERVATKRAILNIFSKSNVDSLFQSTRRRGTIATLIVSLNANNAL